MRILSRIFFSILFFQAVVSSPAFAEPASCGFTQSCDKGMVCVGSTDVQNNGQCILSPILLSVCTVFNSIQEYSTYFMIFSVVALGFAFFLGKISWGMIISVILGITMIKGAILITQKTTGISSNYCSTELVTYTKSCKNTKWDNVESQSIVNVKQYYNINATILCPIPMQCMQYSCKPYATWGETSGNTVSSYSATNSKPEGTVTLNRINDARTKSGLTKITSISQTYILRSNGKTKTQATIAGFTEYLPSTNDTYFTLNDLADVAPSDIPSTLKLNLSCSQIQSSEARNYLVCKNSCTGSVQNIDKGTCADLA